MKKEFEFLGNVYNDELSFGLALHNNFADALNYIFTDKFINEFSDAYLRGRVLVELRTAKYVESALAMIIYLLNPDLGLSVRGKSFKTLHELAEYMHKDDELHITIEHLFSDHVITHTLGLNEDVSELTRKKLMDIEDNITDPAIYKLFVYLYNINFTNNDYHGLNRFDYYFYAVKGSNDPFLAYYNVVNNLGFKADLLKSNDINEVLSYYKDEALPFLIYRDLSPLLMVDISEVLTSGNHIFLAKSLKQYKTKKLASKVKKQIKKAYKKLNKPQIVEAKIENAKKLYLLANLFYKLWDLGLIKAKNESYSLNKLNGLRCSEAYNKSVNYFGDTLEAYPIELDKKELKATLKTLKKNLKEIKKI